MTTPTLQPLDLVNLAVSISVFRDQQPMPSKAREASARAISHLYNAASSPYQEVRKLLLAAASVSFTLAGIYSRKGK